MLALGSLFLFSFPCCIYIKHHNPLSGAEYTARLLGSHPLFVPSRLAAPMYGNHGCGAILWQSRLATSWETEACSHGRAASKVFMWNQHRSEFRSTYHPGEQGHGPRHWFSHLDLCSPFISSRVLLSVAVLRTASPTMRSERGESSNFVGVKTCHSL